MTLAKNEGLLFKYGSGTGTNLSPLRSRHETLRGGGTASGPVSFMKGFDAFAGVIKSGGKTRRAAKMVVLDVAHPDIREFIHCKRREEQKALALIAAGYDAAIDGEAYGSVFFQNANHSVRVSDAFMQAVVEGRPFELRAVTTGEVTDRVIARELFGEIAETAWQCGDPGLQFDDTINSWHTCPGAGRINASNPCCFIGETLVETSEGRVAIEDLAAWHAEGRPLPHALAYDFANRFPTARPINAAWCAGHATSLVRVTTSRGLSFTCTPEHGFYLRDGRAVEARALAPGDRLAKLAFARNEQRANRRVVYHRVTKDNAKGQSWFHRWLWEEVNGPIPDGLHLHHKNGYADDDRLSNYELTEENEHRSAHSKGSENPRFLHLSPRDFVEIWEAIEAQPKRTHQASAAVTPARWNAYVKRNGLAGTIPMAASPSRGGRIHGMPWAQFSEMVESHRVDLNDTVASIDVLQLDEPVPVYDIEVEGVHNFGVAVDGHEHAIVVSNSEYMFLDDSACNLASLNLRRFQNEAGDIALDGLRHAIDVVILAQEIIVDRARYPTEAIAEHSHVYRPLGLGFANLGAFLMVRGVPYDSDPARAYAGALTAYIHGYANLASARIAAERGPFAGFAANRDAVIGVMDRHAAALEALDAALVPHGLLQATKTVWKSVRSSVREVGLRNAQVTLVAPTGTIAFLMDCDTTGIEPDIALVKRKALVGGGSIEYLNRSVEDALSTLGYAQDAREQITSWIRETGSAEGAPGLLSEHLPVFDCAFPAGPSSRSIDWRGHLNMMAAVQPFVSGAISKTVNLPASATVDEVASVYLEAWKLGLKSIAVYRDGSKGSQPLQSKQNGNGHSRGRLDELEPGETISTRRKLPGERRSVTKKLEIGGEFDGYLTVGLYADGRVGEIFVNMAKEGSTISGLIDSFATAVSIGLQYGVPLEVFAKKFSHVRFEPSGFTGDKAIGHAKSIVDYIFRWLQARFPGGSEAADGGVESDATVVPGADADHAICPTCGTVMRPNGSCHVCPSCGTTSGCS